MNPRIAAVLALALALTLSSPNSARASGFADTLSQLTALANGAQQAGNTAGAKAAVLAGLPLFVNLMQQNALHIPKIRKAVEGYNAAAEAIYKGHPVADDGALLEKVIAKHGPTLAEHAEIMAKPNGDAANQLAMQLRAKQHFEQIRTHLIEYVEAAPGPVSHMQAKSAKDVLQAIRTIVDGLVQAEPRTADVMKLGAERAAQVLEWGESALDKNDLFRAMVHADDTAEIATLMLAIDADNADGKKAAQRAEAIKETVVKKYAEQVAKNRMPSAGYTGEGKGSLDKELFALYKKTFPKEKPVKLVIVSPDWRDEERADWDADGKRWIFTRYKMLREIAVSVERTDGKRKRYWVNFMRAFQVWNGKSFGPTQITPIGNWLPYEILEEHAK